MAGETDLEARTITVPSIVSHYTDQELNREYHAKEEYQRAIQKYGVIYKVVSFSEISDVEELKTACREWIRKNYYDGVLSFTVKGIDLHLLGYDKDKLIVGDRIEVEFLDLYGEAPVTKRLTCLSAQYDILKPENSSYKIGIPDVSASIKYRKSVNTSSSKGGAATKPVTEKEVERISIQKMIDEGLILLDFT